MFKFYYISLLFPSSNSQSTFTATLLSTHFPDDIIFSMCPILTSLCVNKSKHNIIIISGTSVITFFPGEFNLNSIISDVFFTKIIFAIIHHSLNTYFTIIKTYSIVWLKFVTVELYVYM